jgi:hypothetical protein
MTFAKWLEDRVVPYREGLGEAKKDLPMLLLLDGHKTHCSEDTAKYCVGNKITLVLPPPHTTHLLQPLDVGVFHEYKAKFRERRAAVKVRYLETIKDPDGDQKLSDAAKKRCQTIGRSLYGLKHGVDPENIRNAFAKTGIHPLNFDTFLANAKDLTEVPADVKERVAMGE